MNDCNWTRTHNHLVRKQTLNHLVKLAKWLSWVVSTYTDKYGNECFGLPWDHIEVCQMNLFTTTWCKVGGNWLRDGHSKGKVASKKDICKIFLEMELFVYSLGEVGSWYLRCVGAESIGPKLRIGLSTLVSTDDGCWNESWNIIAWVVVLFLVVLSPLVAWCVPEKRWRRCQSDGDTRHLWCK